MQKTKPILMETQKKSYKTFYIVTAVIVVVAAIGSLVEDPNDIAGLNDAQPAATIVAKTPEEIAADSIQQDQNLIDEANSTIAEIKAIDWSEYTQELSGPASGVNKIRAWQRALRRTEDRTTPENKAASRKLEKALKSEQLRAFPILRKGYVKQMKTEWWRQDITVTSGGKRTDVIKFSGGTFAANANIGDFQSALSPSMKMLRFYRSEYRWYKESDEYQYYDMVKRGTDGELEEF